MVTDSVLDSPALPLVIELEAQGFTLNLDLAGALEVQPGSRLSVDQRRLLVTLKPAVVTILRCCDSGVCARRDVFRAHLVTSGSPALPLLVFRSDIPYVPGCCFSCGDATGQGRYGRCWRCALAWRLAWRLPIAPTVAAAIDTAKRVA